MSEHDAFEEEMLLRKLSDRDVEDLLQGRAPEASEFAEVAEFSRALQGALPARSARDERDLIRQLAATARSAGLESETEATRVVATGRPRDRRSSPLAPRVAAVARIAAALALVPLLFAGLALADVTLPAPARSAFEALGVSLPNQPATGDESESGRPAGETEGGGDDGSSTTSQGPVDSEANGNAVEKRKHGTAKPNPARAGGRDNGEQGRGRALGKRGLAPGQLQSPGQAHAPGQLKKDGAGAAVEKSSPAPPMTSSKPPAPPGKVKPAKGSAGNGP